MSVRFICELCGNRKKTESYSNKLHRKRLLSLILEKVSHPHNLENHGLLAMINERHVESVIAIKWIQSLNSVINEINKLYVGHLSFRPALPISSLQRESK